MHVDGQIIKHNHINKTPTKRCSVYNEKNPSSKWKTSLYCLVTKTIH